VCFNLDLADSAGAWFTLVRPVWRCGRCVLYTDPVDLSNSFLLKGSNTLDQGIGFPEL